MKLIKTRAAVAALGLSLLAQGAWAQTPANITANTPANAAPATTMPPTATPMTLPAIVTPPSTAAAPATANTPAASASTRQAKHAEMAKHQQALLEKLNLSPAQKIQFDAAQSARQDVRKQKRANMLAHKKAISEQVAQEQMDPRAVIEADKQSRAMMDTKRMVAEQKWLAFWDGLNPEQRKTFTADMKTRQEHHAKKPHAAPQG